MLQMVWARRYTWGKCVDQSLVTRQNKIALVSCEEGIYRLKRDKVVELDRMKREVQFYGVQHGDARGCGSTFGSRLAASCYQCQHINLNWQPKASQNAPTSSAHSPCKHDNLCAQKHNDQVSAEDDRPDHA